MATLAGNVGLKISSRLQFCGLLIPWVSKKNAILCVKGRDYSSSFPVRYVPKKSVKIKESENSVPVKGLERNEPPKQSYANASELTIEVLDSGRGVKKSLKINKAENSVPVNGLEGNEPREQPDASELRIEVSSSGRDVTKPLKINEPVNGLHRNEPRKQSDASELHIEVSNSGRNVKKSYKINESGDSVPVNGLERNELQKQSDASELRILLSNSGRDVKRSIASDKKFQNHNQMTNNNILLDAAKQEFGEEINCEHGLFEESEVFEEPREVAEDMKILKQKDIYLQADKARQDAENLAVKLLATRAFTAVEMRKKLNGKKFPSHVIEAMITDFQSRGLINDSLYAESYSRSRWSSASWGPRRIKQALFNKGIGQTDATNAVNLVFRDGESDDDQESKLGMSKHLIDHLFVQASKQWLRSQDAPKETRKSRIIRWLQYRGFDWGVTSLILKKLESQYPS